MTRARPVVAIDGPAGAGKSTAAMRLAQRLGFVLVDTGALYRGIALSALEKGLGLDDGAGLGALARGLTLEFQVSAQGVPHILIDGRDRAADIRTPEVSMAASEVSRHSEVRQALLSLQRRLGADGGVVLEGRDIGTVVFPDAEVKVFLTADARTRAQRRVTELRTRGLAASLETTLAEVQDRDRRDSSRAVAPLKPAVDAVHVDTSGMELDEVVDRLVALVESRTARPKT